jgi:hypothetical protein
MNLLMGRPMAPVRLTFRSPLEGVAHVECQLVLLLIERHECLCAQGYLRRCELAHLNKFLA